MYLTGSGASKSPMGISMICWRVLVVEPWEPSPVHNLIKMF